MHIYLLSLLVFLLGVTGHLAQVSNTLKFSDSFESGDLSKWRFSGNETSKVVQSPVRSGQHAVGMVVGPDDVVPYRSELVIASYDGQFHDHEEFWISLSFLVDDWGDVIPYWGSIFQIHSRPHQLPDGSGPDWNCNAGKNPITISTRYMNLALNVVKDPDHTQMPGNGAIATEVWSEELQLGVWYDWTFRYRSSLEDDGIIEAWMNGNKIYEQYGANRYLLDNCGMPTTPLPYMKIGIYREKGISSTQKLFMDEVYVYAGTDGYDAVQPPEIRVVDTEKPSTPLGLTSSNIAETSFSVSWSPATDNVGVDEYEVYQDGERVKTTDSTSIKLTKLDAGTTYEISIVALDEEGNMSTHSQVLRVPTLQEEVPVEPIPVTEPVVPIAHVTPVTLPGDVTKSDSVPVYSITPSQVPPVYSPGVQPTHQQSEVPDEKMSEPVTKATPLEYPPDSAIQSEQAMTDYFRIPKQLLCYVMNIALYIVQTDVRCHLAP